MASVNLKEAVEENIYLTRYWNLKDWEHFREWCNYYEIRKGMPKDLWTFKKNQLIKKYVNTY